MSSFEIYGLKDVGDKIQFLNLNAARIIGPAVKAGAKVFQQAAKVNVLRMLGKLREPSKKTLQSDLLGRNVTRTIYNNLVVAPRKKRKRGETVYNARIRAGAPGMVYHSAAGNRSYIPAAIEYGHRAIMYGKDLGKRVPPIPYMRQAYMSHRHMAKQVILDKALAAIERAATKQSIPVEE